MIGLDLADHDVAVALEQECFRRGLLVLTCGERSVRLAPPLVIRPTRWTPRSRCWRTRSPPSPRVVAVVAPRSSPPRRGAARRPRSSAWTSSRGRPCTVWPRAPLTVSAAQRLLMTASSAASTTAANIGFSAASSIGPHAGARRRAERGEDLAAAVAGDGAGPGQAEADPAGQALQLGRGARRVGGDDADAAARVPAVRGRLRRWAERAADGDAVHGEPVGRAEVGEEEDADRVPALDHAGGRADAALPLAADHAGAGADRSLGHRSGRRAEHRRPDVLGRDLGAPGVVEPGVVALADHGDGHHVPADATARARPAARRPRPRPAPPASWT